MSQQRKRDYKAEYARRLERGLAKGLTRSQARGHPKAKEKYIAPKRRKEPDKQKIGEAVLSLSKGNSLAASARSAGVTPEKLRSYVKENKLARKRKGRWVVRQNLLREIRFFSEGKIVSAIFSDFKSASLIGSYLASVKKFLESNNPSSLDPFEDISVTDANGTTHLLETNPNTLYRLNSSGIGTFEQIYRIVV